MRALVLGLALLVLIYFVPCVAAQPSWGITNPGSCPDWVDYTQTTNYVCIVEWYVDVRQFASDVTVLVSLIDMEHGVVLDSREYSVQSGSYYAKSTTLATYVPRSPGRMWLRVDLTVQGGGFFGGPGSSDYYDLTVTVVPEFPAAAPVLLASLILAMTVTRKIKKVGKGGSAGATAPLDVRSCSSARRSGREGDSAWE